ncbi:MAG: M23 family metallopeptidase [Defluviitaleaceae bacterium]|nr:M23 family metallopeptidase [Defluviitaleaceae bacterium]
MKKWIFAVIPMVLLVFTALVAQDDEGDFVKWFDFDVPAAVLRQAYKYDVKSQEKGDAPLDFVQLLAYSAAKNWGSFKSDSECKHMEKVVERVRNGERLHDITQDMDLYNFYLVAYGAVLGGFVGDYEVDGKPAYGLKVFSPIAKGFNFTHSDDFGNPRNYGYSRPHLGHDMFGAVGTPIIAVECGIVEALGWNRYGGWRIGIRSLDNKRYYYYAHLQKNTPYAQGLAEGALVQAGDVIGFLGNTGYSHTENATNIKQPHLHFGMQIIFDESQKNGNNQIWIDTYAITRFLNQNRMEVERVEDGQYRRKIQTNSHPFS